MTCTIHVNGKSNSLVHKGSMGIAKSTLPDVCKTPSPGGPVPIPYPVIVSMSSDLKKGSKKVKVDGGNSAAIKGSEFSRCTGDEPGTAGGVKSSTNMKEATWILYSFDVKIEGKNACRLSDKMMMNHGNTACLNGTMNPPVSYEQLEKEMDKIAKKCCKEVEDDVANGKLTKPKPPKKKGKKPSCSVKGTWKHKCCQDALEKKNYEDVTCEGNCGTGNCRLDVAVGGNPIKSASDVEQIYDYKFRCSDKGQSKLSKTQRDKYDVAFPDVPVEVIAVKC